MAQHVTNAKTKVDCQLISPKFMVTSCLYCPLLQALGIVFGIVSTYMRIHDNQEEQVYDRCYRLRYNVGQVRTDKFTYGGLVLGGIGGMAAGLGSSPVVGGIQGASLGAGLAVLGHVLTKRKEKK